MRQAQKASNSDKGSGNHLDNILETVHKKELSQRDRKGQIELIKIYIDTCKLDRGRVRVWGSLMCKQVTECAYLVADYLRSGQFYVRVGAGM